MDRLQLGQGDVLGDVDAEPTPEDLILATSLLSRPLPGLAPSLMSRKRSGDTAWDRLVRRQIDLMLEGLDP